MNSSEKVLHSIRKIKLELEQISHVFDIHFEKNVTWKQVFETWNENDLKFVNGTANECIKKTKKHMQFITKIPSSHSFDEHYHDFLETCFVLEGELYDENSKMTWFKGETVTFDEMVKHTPKNISDKDCLLRVDFFNN